MAGCAACGDCCELIAISQSPVALLDNFLFGAAGERLEEMDAAGEVNNYEFILDHWQQISLSEASAINHRFVEQMLPVRGRFFYRCDQWDPVSRLCTAHACRPPVCRDFPWYKGPAGERYSLLPWPRCSYWHDLPREAWPAGIEPLPDPQNVC